LAAEVKPGVVTIVVPGIGKGSGFVIDEQGLIATNYHVIEGAKQAELVFHDKTKAEVEGFLHVLPGKDLALLRIQPGAIRLVALPLADAEPAQGEKVLAFGAPIGFSDSVTDGIVSAPRTGENVRNTLREMLNRDVYVEKGYDLDARWIQTTAPISHGNSGGPLVNNRGEVVGINTWSLVLGQNLNFAVSATHIKQLVANAGNRVRSLAELPPPRARVGPAMAADGKRTLEYWNERKKIRAEFAEDFFREGVDAFQDQRRFYRDGVAGFWASWAKLLAERAERLASMDPTGVDEELVTLVLAEATSDRELARCLLGFALTAKARGLRNAEAEAELKAIAQKRDQLGVAFDTLRTLLSKKYGLEFPKASSP
jgi:hypothetical protein